jgi:hypothetical protein
VNNDIPESIRQMAIEYGPNPPTGIKRRFLLLILGPGPDYTWLNKIITGVVLALAALGLVSIGYFWASTG